MNKILKFLLPHGIVQIGEWSQFLKRIGIQLEGRSFLEYGKIITSMRICGLDLLPPGAGQNLKLVIDIGANTGLWSRHFLNCAKPEKLISYEPVPHVFKELETILRPHPFAEARCIALGNSQGKRTFYVTKDTTGASLLPPKAEMNELVKGNWDVQEEINCEADTLDNQLNGLPTVDLLKIDVQGAEIEVLKGATNTLTRTRYLLVEFNYMDQYEGGSSLTDLHEYITLKTGFYLHNISRPLIIGTKAVYSDALYINPLFPV